MKTVYITEGQVKTLGEHYENRSAAALLTEENSTVKKKVKDVIRQFCNSYLTQYLDTPLSQLPMGLRQQLNPGGRPTAMWTSVSNNPNENKFIDFLKVNIYDQLGTKRDKGPWEYVVGGARILCQDLGFYSFDPNIMRGGDIIKFSKLLRMVHNHKDIFIGNGPDMDRNLNGMDYSQFMSTFADKYNEWKESQTKSLNSEDVVTDGDYTVVAITDQYEGSGCIPIGQGRALLNRLDNYTDWCICGTMQDFEYPQYTGGGGKVYIMMKNGFENVPKEVGENCPLDEYGLSLICVIVGPDGIPDNITTRWNHENGGENPDGMSTALELQRVTHVKYFDIFKPRTSDELAQMHMLDESSDTPSAMDQVDKVNSGIMDAITGCGMMEEGQGNLEKWYRGYNSKYGSERTHLLWLASDISYARAYGNRVEEVVVDMDKLNLASLYELDGICGYEVDHYDGIDEEDAAKAMAEGFGGYEFEVAENEGYECLCIWDKSCIVSRRELPKEEFDSIESIEGYDNPGYDDEMRPMFYQGLLSENSNDRKVNKYIKEKFGLTDFQDIRNKVMEIYERIPYARINGGQYMLGVMRLLFEENLPKEEYSVLNRILYKIAHCNFYEKEKDGVLDPNFGGQKFEELKEKLFVPDFAGEEFSTAEKQIKVQNGYTVTRIDSYDEMNAVCDGEWCISYDDSMWYDLIEDGTVYLVENERLIDEYDRAYEKDPEYWQDLGYMAGEEDEMYESGYIDDKLSWTNKPGSWKFPYDLYGLSRFVVVVYKNSFSCYSRYNMPNEFDGDYLNKNEIENLLGIRFEDVFKPVKVGQYNGWEYDDFGRRVPFGSAVQEGAEPESDEYSIGGEGGNNEYFHAMNESKEDFSKYKKFFKPLADFMRKSGLNVYPYPKVKLNWEEQDGLFIKTGYYEPDSKTIVIFCQDRHPKDILRTFAHEMIHHSQNLNGIDLNFSSNDDVKDNDRLEKVESEAYLKGNVYFRKWTEYQNKNDDLLQEGKERKNDKGETVPEKCDKCGGDVVCQIHGEPVFVCKDCGKYFGTMPFSLNESIDIKKALAAQKKRRDPDWIENLYEDTNPEDIDLSSFNIKTELNPKFWKDGRLDSRIRMRLLDIADDFIDFLGIDWVKPEDVIITGSLANFNWNKKFSDIDLHVVVDYSKVDKRKDFVDNYFYSQKKLWNEEHKDLKIFGFPIEVYVQDKNEKHSSTGVYSLDKDKWIVEPKRSKLKNAKVNKSLIKSKVANYIDKIENLLTIYKGAEGDYEVRKVSERADKLFDDIKSERKNGLDAGDNEISNGNIIFKCLRRLGYIEKLTNLMSKTYDKMNSLS